MFDWQDLHFFSVLARQGSLSATARELGVDHATVGRRIASLEAAIGLRLIDRLPRSCPLTEDGVAIAALAGQMEAPTQAVLRRARSAASLLSATIRVSAPPALATFCIAPHVGELRRAHPDLKLVLQASSSVAALDRGEADIAVRLSRPQEKGAVARKIGVMRFGVYASIDYAARPPESWEFIAFDEPLDRVPQQAWLRRFLAGRAVAFEASDLFGQLAAAKAGAGVAVLPTIIGECEPSLLRVDATPAPPERDLWLITYPDLRRSPAVREVMAFLAHCVKRTLN
jgi:DNA-binding transcriptional LysR family regulator